MNKGFELKQIKLPSNIDEMINNNDWATLDQWINESLSNGLLRDELSAHIKYTKFEHIISLRAGDDPDEEDGIWHDDGSRELAFTLSLTHNEIHGGELQIRKKNSVNIETLPTQNFGGMIIFQTGQQGYEHRVLKVRSGQRLIVAGWLN